jgi:hypothetical protein
VALTPVSVVSAPEPRGLRYGLFTAANGPLELPEHARSGGLVYEPVSCGHSHVYPVACAAGVTPPSKVFDPADPFITADPFIVYASYVCGTVGHTPSELEAKVRRRLLNGEQTSAEAEMAAILAAGAVDLGGPDPTSIVATVAELEQWLYGIGGMAYGNVGVLHAPARYSAYASVYGLVVQDGPLQRTRLGTVWSFGGGYPDDGTIYISGQVTLWRSSDVFVSPVATYLPPLNQYRLIAEREYVVAYDCVAASADFIVAGIGS